MLLKDSLTWSRGNWGSNQLPFLCWAARLTTKIYHPFNFLWLIKKAQPSIHPLLALFLVLNILNVLTSTYQPTDLICARFHCCLTILIGTCWNIPRFICFSGKCFCLYPEDNQLPEENSPQILESDITPTVLFLKRIEIAGLGQCDFIDRPG